MTILIILLVISLFMFAMKRKKRGIPTRTKQQKQDDELITVILPTIQNDK